LSVSCAFRAPAHRGEKEFQTSVLPFFVKETGIEKALNLILEDLDSKGYLVVL
jgi:hypothetical protein